MKPEENVDPLVVTHRLRGARDEAPRPTDSNGLRVVTCLRELDIGLRGPGHRQSLADPGTEVRLGREAYQLLLEITTGLRSEIPGETNVFGQFRRAWLAFAEEGCPALTARLSPVMRRLFVDTKTVRQHWLQGIGGHSYGSLVRRLIGPQPGEAVLFVGYGDLARSMLPLFSRYRTGLWNRHALDHQPDIVTHSFAPDQAHAAASFADHVILTTPADALNDARWRHWLTASPPRTLVHTGHREAGTFSAEALLTDTRLYALDDLFRLRRTLDHDRAARLDRARHACAALAGLTRPDLIAA